MKISKILYAGRRWQRLMCRQLRRERPQRQQLERQPQRQRRCGCLPELPSFLTETPTQVGISVNALSWILSTLQAFFQFHRGLLQ